MTRLVPADAQLKPMSTGLGLERFKALRHLDMQSVCGEAPVLFEVPTYERRQEWRLSRLALPPAAVRQLTALSGSLQTLRLAYDEGGKV